MQIHDQLRRYLGLPFLVPVFLYSPLYKDVPAPLTMNATPSVDVLCEPVLPDDDTDGVTAASSAPAWQIAAVTYHLEEKLNGVFVRCEKIWTAKDLKRRRRRRRRKGTRWQ